MRLLYYSRDGRVSLTKEFASDNIIPYYAILSHTWGLDNNEVMFEDIRDSVGKDKPSYEKIRFCGEQGIQDSLKYF